MKKIAILFLMFLSVSVSAQYKDVILPQKPQTSKYEIPEAIWCAFEADASSSIMEHKANMQFFNISCVGGYRFSEYLRIGIGVGGRVYVNNADLRNTDSKFGFPIFVNARGNFISAYDRDGVPFWSINVGGTTNEGVFINPTIGYSFGGIRNNFYVGLSYTLNQFKDYMQLDQSYSYIGLKIGYEL